MDEESKSPRRLMLVMLVLAAIQLGTAVHMLQLPADTAERITLPREAQTAASGIWMVLFIAAAVDLYRHGQRAVTRGLWLLAVFILYSGLRLVIFSQADYDRQRLPFILALMALLLVVIASVRLLRNLPINDDRDGE